MLDMATGTTENGLHLLWEFLQYEDLIHDVIGTMMDMVRSATANSGAQGCGGCWHHVKMCLSIDDGVRVRVRVLLRGRC